MELEEEYTRNRTVMKKIKNQDTQCFIAFAANLMIILFFHNDRQIYISDNKSDNNMYFCYSFFQRI